MCIERVKFLSIPWSKIKNCRDILLNGYFHFIDDCSEWNKSSYLFKEKLGEVKKYILYQLYYIALTLNQCYDLNLIDYFQVMV